MPVNVPHPVVVSAEFLGEMTSRSSGEAGVLFQDGAQPVSMPGGTLWVFGDTFLGHRDPAGKPKITGAAPNTIAWLPAGVTDFPPPIRYFTGAGGIAAVPLTTLPNEDAKKLRIWPAGGVALGTRIYLFYSMIESLEGVGPWNFRGIGPGLAVADTPLSSFRRLLPGGWWKFPVEAICVLPHDGYLYCYEVANTPVIKGLLLARVRPAAIEEPAAYEFFTGTDWSTRREDAAIILREAYGQVSVVWSPALAAYLMATSSDFSHAQEIQLRTSPTPWGPWGEPTRLPVPPRVGKTTELVYCTFFHPELSAPDGSEITMTFCRVLKGEWELTNPKMVKVRLALPK
jgi:hypothetical protein